MEKILNLGKIYKYEIMGIITLCILYLCFHIYSKKEKNEEKIVKQKVNNDMNENNSKKELRLLISEIRKMSMGMKEMLEYNKSLNPKDNYFNFRDQYFTRDIEKIRILIDTKSMGPHHDDEHTNTSQYKVIFGSDKVNIPQNTICFGEKLNDVVGFRLSRATIPDTLYNVTTTNQTFKFSVNGGNKLNGTFRQGAYSFQSLATEFEKALNDQIVGTTPFTVTTNIGSFKYIVNYTGPGDVIFYWSETENQVHKLVGGSGETETITNSEFPYTFRNTVDHSIHFVDLVIPEIPSIASKIGANGYNIIDRIPLSGIRGNLITYIPLEEGTPWTQNFFYPININQLSITLYDDTTSNLFKNNNNDHMLEFEISILKNTKLLK